MKKCTKVIYRLRIVAREITQITRLVEKIQTGVASELPTRIEASETSSA